MNATQEGDRAAWIATPAEAGVIKDPVDVRYPAPEPAEDVEDMDSWDDSYADAMREVYQQYAMIWMLRPSLLNR